MTRLYSVILTALLLFNVLQTNAQPVPIDRKSIDSTVAPGDDFYRFANGEWLKKTTIPGNQGMWAPIVDIYQGNTKFVEDRVRQLATQTNKLGSVNQLLGDFYASGMDTNRIETLNYRPLMPYLDAVDKIHNQQDILDFIARNIAVPTNALINLNAEPDGRNNQIQIATISQSGLAFPASYYLGMDSKSQMIQNQYQHYLAQILILTGTTSDQAKSTASQILSLEKLLAGAHNTPEQNRQPNFNYHPLTVLELQRNSPGFNWNRFFQLAKVKPRRVNLAQPLYYQRLVSLLNTIPVEIWRDKLKTDFITTHAAKLSRSFQNTRFAFFNKILSGQQQPEPRGQTMMNRVVYPLRDLVGQLYVKERFSDSAKQQVLVIVKRIQTVYSRRLQAISWLSPTAKKEALRKLEQMTKKIGYPDRWDTYEGLSICRDDFFGNTTRLYQRARWQNLQSIDQPVDKSRWRFMASGTGASYSGSENAITLTAGYLQPPYFWPGADDAIMYGTIGRTIGHEITHAFDDAGRRYDADGNLKNWWTTADSIAYVKQYTPLMMEFNQYTVLDSLKNNGKLTIGENIADLVGLSVAYEVFTETPQFNGGVVINGLTPAQRFFLSYAQEQRAIYTPQMVRMMIYDAHPLEEFRVNGTVRNFSPFYDAFNISPSDKLFKKPESRISIW